MKLNLPTILGLGQIIIGAIGAAGTAGLIPANSPLNTFLLMLAAFAGGTHKLSNGGQPVERSALK